jgi:hypothetical protein
MFASLLLVLSITSLARMQEHSLYQASLSKFERPTEILACIHLVRHIDYSSVDKKLGDIMADPNYIATRAATSGSANPTDSQVHADTREFLYILIGSCYDTLNTIPVKTKKLLMEQATSSEKIDKELIDQAFDMENAFRIFSTMSSTDLEIDDISALVDGMRSQSLIEEKNEIKDYNKAIDTLQDILNSRLDTIESGRYLSFVAIGAWLFAYLVAYYSTKFCCKKIKKIEEKEVKQMTRVSMRAPKKNTTVDQSAELNLLVTEEQSAADTLAKLEIELKQLTNSD